MLCCARLAVIGLVLAVDKAAVGGLREESRFALETELECLGEHLPNEGSG